MNADKSSTIKSVSFSPVFGNLLYSSTVGAANMTGVKSNLSLYFINSSAISNNQMNMTIDYSKNITYADYCTNVTTLTCSTSSTGYFTLNS